MVQGTASNVGKSFLATALCRILREDGYRVAPFKAQNMSNNSYITADGGEIGRAQGVQAEAAGVEPTVDMNPVLLKPSGEEASQVIIHGRPVGEMDFRHYRCEVYEVAARAIRESLDRLRAAFEVVVIEGAGSPAEVNLREGELANMSIAAWAQAPVLLVGDIERGGVLASLVGTLDLLEPAERKRVAGMVINKFRGDRSLLDPALGFLERRTGIPVLGVLPYLDVELEAEDSLILSGASTPPSDAGLRIGVVRLPHISNFTDLDPLRRQPGVVLRYVDRPWQLDNMDAVILPGSKNTAGDLRWLWRTGLASTIQHLAALGRPVVGLCGGFQMMGRRILDPGAVESPFPETPGLGLLDIETQFAPLGSKVARRSRGLLNAALGPFAKCPGVQVLGYEIHLGRTSLGPSAVPLFQAESADTPGEGIEGSLGAMGPDGLHWGTYLHDLFHNDDLREAWMAWLWVRKGCEPPGSGPHATKARASAVVAIAAGVRPHLNLEFIYGVLGLPGPRGSER